MEFRSLLVMISFFLAIYGIEQQNDDGQDSRHQDGPHRNLRVVRKKIKIPKREQKEFSENADIELQLRGRGDGAIQFRDDLENDLQFRDIEEERLRFTGSEGEGLELEAGKEGRSLGFLSEALHEKWAFLGTAADLYLRMQCSERQCLVNKKRAHYCCQRNMNNHCCYHTHWYHRYHNTQLSPTFVHFQDSLPTTYLPTLIAEPPHVPQPSYQPPPTFHQSTYLPPPRPIHPIHHDTNHHQNDLHHHQDDHYLHQDDHHHHQDDNRDYYPDISSSSKRGRCPSVDVLTYNSISHNYESGWRSGGQDSWRPSYNPAWRRSSRHLSSTEIRSTCYSDRDCPRIKKCCPVRLLRADSQVRIRPGALNFSCRYPQHENNNFWRSDPQQSSWRSGDIVIEDDVRNVTSSLPVIGIKTHSV